MARLIVQFIRLRWRLLRGSLRGDGSERIGVIASTTASAFVAVVGSFALAAVGRTIDDPTTVFVVVTVAGVAAVVMLGVISGVSQPIDPRVLAAEPLGNGHRSIGLLAATAVGPPGLAAIALGAGLGVGAVRQPHTAMIVVPAVLAWLIALALAARTATNLLALLVNRAPRLGQVVMGLSGLAIYVTLQLTPTLLVRIGASGRDLITDVLTWTPVGQLGRSMAVAESSMIAAGGHLVLGSLTVPLLGVVHAFSTRRLTEAASHSGSRWGSTRRAGRSPTDTRPMHRPARWYVGGAGAVGAVARRAVLTRFRAPRTAIETFLGGGIGLAAVLAPALLRDEAGSGAVLVGGAVQLAVLFMAGNTFGNDGPALANELLTGVPPRTLALGTARSIAFVAAPIAVAGPLVAAGVTGEWRFLPAGLLVGFGGLLAGTGGAIVQSTFVPVAMPDSDNPFAHGESGRGLVAALLLLTVLVVLALATVPLFLALFWANAFGSALWVTAFGVITLAVGWGLMRAGVAVSARRITTHGPEFVRAVTPTR